MEIKLFRSFLVWVKSVKKDHNLGNILLVKLFMLHTIIWVSILSQIKQGFTMFIKDKPLLINLDSAIAVRG